VTERPALPHSRAAELLPWFVNGTLSGAEREAVDAHVRACIACRRELKEQQRLFGAVRARRTADVSAEAGFDRLDRAIDDTALAPRSWTRRYAAAGPFAIAAAAGLAVLALLLWFTPLPQLSDGQYSTLAESQSGAGAMLDIVFAEETTAAEMQQLLDDIGGEIVAGPSNLGRYSVRIADSAHLKDLLGTLAADSRVRFAARSLTDPPP
jgi:hypothetical protein